MSEENKKKSPVSAVIGAMSSVIEGLGMVTLVIMTVVVCFTVVTRYFLSYTPSWSESGSLLCMVWFGFLSMALGVRDNQHISITILDQLLGQKAIDKLNYFKEIAIFLFGIFLIAKGIELCEIGALNVIPGLGLSSAWQYAAVPVSGVAMSIYALQQFINEFRGKENKL